MPTINYDVLLTGLGSTVGGRIARSGTAGVVYEIPLAGGKTGTLSTRTDDETGTLTLESGHGITTGAIIDLYWSGGSRRNITVGTVSGTSVPIGADDSGFGSNLPTATTAVIACVQTEFNVSIDGDEVAFIVLGIFYAASGTSSYTATLCHLSLRDSGESEVAAYGLLENYPHIIDIAGGKTNSLTGSPILIGVASNGSASAGTLQIQCVQNA